MCLHVFRSMMRTWPKHWADRMCGVWFIRREAAMGRSWHASRHAWYQAPLRRPRSGQAVWTCQPLWDLGQDAGIVAFHPLPVLLQTHRRELTIPEAFMEPNCWSVSKRMLKYPRSWFCCRCAHSTTCIRVSNDMLHKDLSNWIVSGNAQLHRCRFEPDACFFWLRTDAVSIAFAMCYTLVWEMIMAVEYCSCHRNANKHTCTLISIVCCIAGNVGFWPATPCWPYVLNHLSPDIVVAQPRCLPLSHSVWS